VLRCGRLVGLVGLRLEMCGGRRVRRGRGGLVAVPVEAL